MEMDGVHTRNIQPNIGAYLLNRNYCMEETVTEMIITEMELVRSVIVIVYCVNSSVRMGL